MTVTSPKISAVSSGTWNAAKAKKNLLADADLNAFLRATKPASSDSKLAGSTDVSTDIEMAAQKNPKDKAVNTVVKNTEDRSTVPSTQEMNSQLYNMALHTHS